MAKLYPPYIENVLPAFDYKVAMITVPFQLNRAVNRNDFKRLAIIIRTVSTGAIKVDETLSSETIIYNVENNCYEAKFDLRNKFQPQIGQFYKIQVAFENFISKEIGYYSMVGIAKCTAEPIISIDQLKVNEVNQNISTYTGKYSQVGENKDPTERVYSYQFDVKDIYGKLVATSGECLHNASTDISANQSEDKWTMDLALELNKEYNIEYKVKTLNNFEASSVKYRIMEIDSKDLDHLHIDLVAKNIADEGYVEVSLSPRNNVIKKIKGHFILMRSSSKNNFQSWNEIYRFDMVNETAAGKHLWNDFSVEQGITYRYSIQAYNAESVYSNRLLSKDVVIDFEDCFLYDGEKQLKIRFNPKISSFKRTLLESKVDTLGGKHPFIFRNGRVDYKEFPISGLISLISDPNEFFVKGVQCADLGPRSGQGANREEDILKVSNSKTDLTAENYYQERQFKMAALEWLSDGKPKLFRSAAEGNYIVRLMNVSLSPVDALGRMLHNFQCTAYEIADCTFANLEKYGFIKGKTPAPKDIKVVGLANLKDFFKEYKKIDENNNIYYQYDFPGSVEYLVFENFFTDIKFRVIYQDGKSSEDFIVNNNTNTYYTTGATAAIALIVEDRLEDIPDTAMITYGYYEPALTSDFAYITDIKIEDKINQYIGCTDNRGHSTMNLLDYMADSVRTEVGRIHYLAIQPREVVYIFKKDDGNENLKQSYYKDSKFTEKVQFQDDILYFVKNKGYFIEGLGKDETIRGEHIKAEMNYTIQINNEDYTDLTRHKVNYIDRDNRDVEVEGRFDTIIDLDTVNRFIIGDGLMTNIVYQLKTITYSIEDTNTKVMSAKAIWQGNPTEDNYQKYIKALEDALKEEAEVVYAI